MTVILSWSMCWYYILGDHILIRNTVFNFFWPSGFWLNNHFLHLRLGVHKFVKDIISITQTFSQYQANWKSAFQRAKSQTCLSILLQNHCVTDAIVILIDSSLNRYIRGVDRHPHRWGNWWCMPCRTLLSWGFYLPAALWWRILSRLYATS